MLLKRLWLRSALVLLVTGVLVAGQVYAQAGDDDGTPTTRELVDEQLTRYRDALALSDYQWTQVERILHSDIRERVAIAQRFGLDGSDASAADMDKKQVRALERALKDSREFTEERMKRYLEKDKFKEFKALQEDIHEEFEQRLEAARQ
jgi:hypothetical protein